MSTPWADALRRAAGAGAPPGIATTSAPGIAPSPETVDPARMSPALAALIGEREALQSGIAALTGGVPADPRFAVAPLADRRAELARWGAARDTPRGQPEAMPPPARAAMPLLPGTQPPALRPTPGEAVPAGSVPVDPNSWMAARDAATRSAAPVPDRRAAETPPPAGDALDRRLARARNLVGQTRAAATAANRALDAARDVIPDGWEERARERIPGLGRADPYVRESARKLAVAVGTIDELTSKADQMRELASNVRNLREADAANDDARRDRALDNLRARRAADA